MIKKIEFKKIKCLLFIVCSLLLIVCLSIRPSAFAQDEQTDVIEISSEAEFIEFAQNCAEYEYSLNKTFVLTEDLNFKNSTAAAVPVFNGVFDGKNHTIADICFNDDKDNVSLFNKVNSGAEIKNLKFSNLNIKSANGSYTSLVARNYGSITNVEMSGVIDGERYVGGLTAYNGNGAKIENCLINCTVFGILNVGGVAGFNSGEIYNCTNKGKINAVQVSTSQAGNMTNAGGIVGYSTGKLTNCINDGNVGYLYQGRYIGGIAGLSDGEVYFCGNNADVLGNNYVGGIFGYYGRLQNNSDENNDYLQDWLDRYFGNGNDGDINFEEGIDLGVHKISYCYNTGDVSAENYAGGISGCLNAINAVLKNSFANCQIFTHTNYAGGIAADQISGRIESCSTSGTVTCRRGDYAGGIAGSSANEIYACTSNVKIEGNNYLGGIAGKADDLQNCYANVTVISNDGQYAGNIAGFAGSGSAVSVAKIKNNFFVGGGFGIDGVNYGSATEYAATKLTAEELKSQNTLSSRLVGFDENRWFVSADKASYPMLKTFYLCDAETNYTDFSQWFDNAKTKFTAQNQAASTPFVKAVFWQWNENNKYTYYTTVTVPYGQGIANLPTLPQIDGYFTWWQDANLSNLTQDIDVYQQVDKYITTVASEESKTPQFIAEGIFYSDTTLQAVKDGDKFVVKLFRNGKEISYDTLTIKYFTNGSDDFNLSVSDGNEFVSKDFKTFGQYIVFEIKQNQSFRIVPKPPVNHLWLYLGIGIGVAVAATVATLLIVKFKKRKKIKD